MKKKKNGRLSWQDIFAPILGLGSVYIATLVLLFARLYAQFYFDATNGNAFSTMVKFTNPKQMTMPLLKNTINFYGNMGMVSGIALFLLIIFFVYMGWFVMKLATHKAWYLPAIPVLFIALFAISPSYGSYSAWGMPFTQLIDSSLRFYLAFICILAALLGGWINNHVSVHK